MPLHGGLTPFPLRYGGGTPLIQRIIESLASQLGTAYDSSDVDGIVYLELLAEARCIAAMWSQNQRLANQWIASRMTDFLPRWEKIYRLPVFASDTLATRRARVAVAQARVGEADGPAVRDVCSTIMGAAFVSLVHTTSSGAVVWTPATWPFGLHGTLSWYSTVAHVAVKLSQPSSMSDADFYDRAGSLMVALDGVLPAWVTFDWYREGGFGAGFYLDDEANLDNQAFD
jgi:hypothetical protein